MFNKSIVIDNFNIQNHSKPYLIAEISGNHDNEIDRAKKLILAAKENGFDAVKIPVSYTHLTLPTNREV